MFAPAKGLSNVIAFVDANRRQLDGFTDEVMPLGDVAAKFRLFGWHSLDVADGNDVDQICDAIEKAQQDERPSMIVLHTVKAKGCTYAQALENNHNCPVTHEQAQATLEELYEQKAALAGEVRK